MKAFNKYRLNTNIEILYNEKSLVRARKISSNWDEISVAVSGKWCNRPSISSKFQRFWPIQMLEFNEQHMLKISNLIRICCTKSKLATFCYSKHTNHSPNAFLSHFLVMFFVCLMQSGLVFTIVFAYIYKINSIQYAIRYDEQFCCITQLPNAHIGKSTIYLPIFTIFFSLFFLFNSIK